MILSFAQGRLASCQTLAAIGAISLKPSGEAILRKMLTRNADGFSVKFPCCEEPVQIEASDLHSHNFLDESCLPAIDGDIEQRCDAESKRFVSTVSAPRYKHASGDFIVRVLESAYAKYQKRLHAELFDNVSDERVVEVYNEPKFHYRADMSIHDLSGLEVETLHASGTVDDSSRSFAEEFEVNPKLREQVLEKLELFSLAPEKYIATVCTFGMPHAHSYHDPGMKIGPWHDHILEKVDHANEKVYVIDPYNSRITLIVHYADFFRYFYLICWAPLNV